MPARKAARLNLLTVREVQHAGDGDHSDGGGLLLRVRGTFSSWVYRFTAPSGRRREMGLGAALRGSAKQAGDTLTGARELAHKAREALRQGIDPIEARERQRECLVEAEQARMAAKARVRWTLARSARDFHARVIEPTRTPKHAAQWISSLENHMPPAVWHAPLDAIDAPALLGVLTAIRPHQRARNLPQGERVAETVQRIRQRLDAVFEDAVFHGRVHQNPAAAIRRKLREATPRREKGSFAALPHREASALLGRVRAMPGTAARCLELAVLCAARTNEVLGALGYVTKPLSMGCAEQLSARGQTRRVQPARM
ncbi:MAG: integrase arm-type DNA-binding domain-containing protein [Rubrivivax sp.]|nr:integrase arm-type DNA-binding domain-containing protein [Rubrivivax sp.]